jgi:hypothetical protein
MGRFQDAIINFNRAVKSGGSVVSKNARANAYKLAGNLDEAPNYMMMF